MSEHLFAWRTTRIPVSEHRIPVSEHRIPVSEQNSGVRASFREIPGFQHLIPSAAAAPLAAHIRPLFLPDLVQQIARNKQIDAKCREQAHPVFRKWAKDLRQGVLQQLHETQLEQDFNHVLLRGLGYTTQSDVASDQPWTLTPKWNVPGSGEVDASLGRFRLDESGWLSGEPLVMVELKGAKVDLDRKMPTRNITPVQQVCT